VPEPPPVDADPSLICRPLASSPLSADEAADLARRLKAIADPHRLRLLSLLMAAPEGEACTCDLTERLDLSQPTVSHHLKRLHDVGLVSAERRGVWTYYRVARPALRAVTAVLDPADA
jgi:ArsR family transcriptional regulator, arsenate/arsenite/antimonite-responsive transcriptional repressor